MTVVPFIVDKLSLVYGLIKHSDIVIKFKEDKAYRRAYTEDENGGEIDLGWLTGGEYQALVSAGLVTKEGEVIRV